ncbi:4Fe-4S domain-containing protein [Thermosporothrix hazakensis]|uniref:4Fe-4S domain-containing protein n=1 Tax=Thermosporothrix hazakensis TaxID=644383 RepID=UPI000DAC180B|nr:ferredoxin [Thermosporothrix hazakensis]
MLACSKVFSQRDSDGVVELLQQRLPLELLKQVQQAVDACPTQVFVVEEEDDHSQLILKTNDEDL